jgi:hypothetical protein
MFYRVVEIIGATGATGASALQALWLLVLDVREGGPSHVLPVGPLGPMPVDSWRWHVGGGVPGQGWPRSRPVRCQQGARFVHLSNMVGAGNSAAIAGVSAYSEDSQSWNCGRAAPAGSRSGPLGLVCLTLQGWR